jgi:HlyD family secretion protein
MARQARDEAERDGADHVAFPAELMAEAGRPEVARLLAGEEALFDIRRRARDGEKRQLEERIAQIEDTIAGREAQVTAKHDEIALIGKELSGVRDLWAKGLVPVYRVTNLERDSTRLEGERAQLASSIAEAKGKIAETKLQMMQIDQELRSEVGKELSEIRGKLSELASRRTAAEAQLARMDIRAPQDGVVQQLNVHTIGGVVAAGEDIMKIVPDRDELVVEVRIRPDDVDQVAPGEHAVLRLSALNQRVTPELAGEVVRVSADAIQDQKTPASYYVVRLKVPQGEFKKLGDVRLVPGMPADAFIQTSSRTLMSYLMKPISDQLKRAFREK